MKKQTKKVLTISAIVVSIIVLALLSTNPFAVFGVGPDATYYTQYTWTDENNLILSGVTIGSTSKDNLMGNQMEINTWGKYGGGPIAFCGYNVQIADWGDCTTETDYSEFIKNTECQVDGTVSTYYAGEGQKSSATFSVKGTTVLYHNLPSCAISLDLSKLSLPVPANYNRAWISSATLTFKHTPQEVYATYYYWRDSTHNECSYKEFTGSYMYQGLETYSTSAECNSHVVTITTETQNPSDDYIVTPEQSIVEPETSYTPLIISIVVVLGIIVLSIVLSIVLWRRRK